MSIERGNGLSVWRLIRQMSAGSSRVGTGRARDLALDGGGCGLVLGEATRVIDRSETIGKVSCTPTGPEIVTLRRACP